MAFALLSIINFLLFSLSLFFLLFITHVGGVGSLPAPFLKINYSNQYMQLTKTAEEGIKKIEKWIKSKDKFHLSSDQKNYLHNGDTTAHFKVYKNGYVEVILNLIEYTCMIQVQGQVVIPINKTLAENPDTFIALVNEYLTLTASLPNTK